MKTVDSATAIMSLIMNELGGTDGAIYISKRTADDGDRGTINIVPLRPGPPTDFLEVFMDRLETLGMIESEEHSRGAFVKDSWTGDVHFMENK